MEKIQEARVGQRLHTLMSYKLFMLHNTEVPLKVVMFH